VISSRNTEVAGQLERGVYERRCTRMVTILSTGYRMIERWTTRVLTEKLHDLVWGNPCGRRTSHSQARSQWRTHPNLTESHPTLGAMGHARVAASDDDFIDMESPNDAPLDGPFAV
jgi:hypothetical protein